MRTTGQLIRDTARFAEKVIQQLPASAGRPALDYVSWNQYAQRLLLDHGAHRYSVTNIVISDKGGVAVSVRVQFSDDEWYDAVGEGDTPTAAESNAYKRACAHAGIGLHLYCDEQKPANQYWLHNVLAKEDDSNGE